MSDATSDEKTPETEGGELQDRRLFLQGMGKWSGAAIMAAVAGTWHGSAPVAGAATWINRRGVRPGGSWINRGGGGSWINRGGGWINRRVGSGGSWINRR
jgi:hypothetical protein